jgi:4-amino-4-deoxy-L-arabinose transferase-like glycosyltransferase
MPSIGLAAAMVGLLYLLGRFLAGPLAGAVAGLLTLTSPLMQEYIIRAQSEAAMCFLLLLALIFTLLAARSRADGAPSLRWLVLAGVTLGLGLQAKLTVILSLVAIGVWAVIVAAQAVRAAAHDSSQTALLRGWRVGRGWLAIAVIAYVTFVATNPYLYQNPIVHSANLYFNRAEEMGRAARYYTADAVDPTLERPALVLGGSLIDGAPFGAQGLPIELALAGLGLFVLAKAACDTRSDDGSTRSSRLFLLTVAAYFIGVSAALMVAWPRYYVPTYLFGALLSGVGLAGLVRLAQQVLQSQTLRLYARTS